VSEPDGWHPFDDGRTIGTSGSESGVVLLDEKHDEGARISLERGGNTPFSIACGVYGTMVHTRFFESEHAAREELAPIKNALFEITQLLPFVSDPHPDFRPAREAVSRFLERSP
jgi:hypothetical protein